MYLKDFDLHQKNAFFKLANEVIHADKELKKEEMIMLTEYQIEMGIAITEELSHNESINIFNSSDESTKRKALFELVALSLSDNEIQKEEDEFLIQLFSELNVDKSVYDAFVVYVEEYLKLISKISSMINN